jgi:hypothetical protein
MINAPSRVVAILFEIRMARRVYSQVRAFC